MSGHWNSLLELLVARRGYSSGCREFRVSTKVLSSFDSTFLSLIPKKDGLSSFHDFKPISLWNYIYKIIANMIATQENKIFSRTIS